jgi:hypothetical protein
MKHITPLLIAALAVSLVAWRSWAAQTPSADCAHEKTPSFSWEEIYRILQESSSLDEYQTNTLRFHDVLNATHERLAAGEATLDESTTAIMEAARLDHPAYLRHLREAEPTGRSDRECVALNLLTYLESGIKASDYPPQTLARLEELRAELASKQFQQSCDLGGD